MRQDDKGITLVEIIIAITVSTIVIGASIIFMRNAMKSYGVAADTIDIQIEAQVLMEQLATWVMEGNFVAEKDDSGNDVFIIYHISRKAPDGADQALMGKNWMRVFWCDGKGKLYMHKVEEDMAPKAPDARHFDYSGWTTEQTRSQLSDYVKGFTVEIDDEDSPSKVTVTLSMDAGTKEYEFTNEINIRNVAYESGP